jgi:hypothetical protein
MASTQVCMTASSDDCLGLTEQKGVRQRHFKVGVGERQW